MSDIKTVSEGLRFYNVGWREGKALRDKLLLEFDQYRLQEEIDKAQRFYLRETDPRYRRWTMGFYEGLKNYTGTEE